MHPATMAASRSDRTRRLALYVIGIIVVAGTVTAFVQSYEGLYTWARRYLSEGWARTWPLQVDAWIAVGELALFVAYRDRWPARRRIWPWVAALTGLAASTGFNIGHLADADLAGQLTAAVPPVAAFGGLFLGMQVLKYVETNRTDRSAPQRADVPLAVALCLAVAGKRRPPDRPAPGSDQRSPDQRPRPQPQDQPNRSGRRSPSRAHTELRARHHRSRTRPSPRCRRTHWSTAHTAHVQFKRAGYSKRNQLDRPVDPSTILPSKTSTLWQISDTKFAVLTVT
jgi:hypothetical protein